MAKRFPQDFTDKAPAAADYLLLGDGDTGATRRCTVGGLAGQWVKGVISYDPGTFKMGNTEIPVNQIDSNLQVWFKRNALDKSTEWILWFNNGGQKWMSSGIFYVTNAPNIDSINGMLSYQSLSVPYAASGNMVMRTFLIDVANSGYQFQNNSSEDIFFDEMPISAYYKIITQS
jgi:hypothetical protein